MIHSVPKLSGKEIVNTVVMNSYASSISLTSLVQVLKLIWFFFFTPDEEL